MKIILDTNAYSDFMRGNATLRDLFESADLIYMSAVVVGELLAGFKLGSQETRNGGYLKLFLEKPRVELLPVGEETAHYYAHLWCAVRKGGNPVPVNDLWIAAQALETSSVLVTRDEHFSTIVGLRCRGF